LEKLEFPPCFTGEVVGRNIPPCTTRSAECQGVCPHIVGINLPPTIKEVIEEGALFPCLDCPYDYLRDPCNCNKPCKHH
jgi:hypothetical protein